MKVGDYECRVFMKNVEESFIPNLKEGDTYYIVRLDKDSYIDVKEQELAEILLRLVRIEKMLTKIGE